MSWKKQGAGVAQDMENGIAWRAKAVVQKKWMGIMRVVMRL